MKIYNQLNRVILVTFLFCANQNSFANQKENNTTFQDMKGVIEEYIVPVGGAVCMLLLLFGYKAVKEVHEKDETIASLRKQNKSDFVAAVRVVKQVAHENGNLKNEIKALQEKNEKTTLKDNRSWQPDAELSSENVELESFTFEKNGIIQAVGVRIKK